MTTTKGQTFTYTYADGEVATRTSKTMTYTHVVLVNGGVWRWSQSEANAVKGAKEFAGRGFTDIRIAPVDGVEGTAAEVATSTPVEAPARCLNSGVVHPRRLYSTCKDCGKEGKVGRFGTLRNHAPAN
jgi:hypothetical protein